jgi:hypothetical protein
MEVLEWTAWRYCRATKCFVQLSRVSSSGKVPDIVCSVLTKSGTSQQIFVEVPDINFTKIGPVGAVLIHAGKQTSGDADKQTDG